MPLRKGSSEADISANIGELMRAGGHSQKQAEAIAYRVAGKDAALDMSHEDWNGLLGGLIKFFMEEEKEPEHATDAEPKGYAASVAFMSPNKHVLLLRRADTEENYPGHWAFPGGKADAGESLEDAAKREANEEIGACSLDGMTQFDRKRTPFGWEHATFTVPSKDEFKPKKDTLAAMGRGEDIQAIDGAYFLAMDKATLGPFISQDMARRAADLAAGRMPEFLAFDKSTTRVYDKDGRLHLESTNISKACVSPYKGNEIPHWQELGLDADKVYQLLRDPKELEKAAPTFNGVPLMRKHVPTSSEDHQPNDVVGSTGTTAVYEHPYLKNGLAVWPQEDIDSIENNEKRELSSSYHYTPDMRPGTYEGVHYDGVMRNIVGNHVAIVEKGRAGPDVMVGDSALNDPAWAAIEQALLGL